MKYRAWMLYSDGFRRLEDSGFVEDADSPEDALLKARARGCAWGCGTNPHYKGLVAIPCDVTDPLF